MREMDAKERILKRQTPAPEPKPAPKPAQIKDRKPRVNYSKVDSNLPIVFNCPICGTWVRFPISRKNCKTCGATRCVDDYRLTIKYPKKLDIPIKCRGLSCCNYLDLNTKQKDFCSTLCAGKSVTKEPKLDKPVTCLAPTCCNFLDAIQKKYCSLSCAARERIRLKNLVNQKSVDF